MLDVDAILFELSFYLLHQRTAELLAKPTYQIELDAVAERVKVAMTDDEVREICEKYFARFHDLHFTISRLRTEYAQGKLTE